MIYYALLVIQKGIMEKNRFLFKVVECIYICKVRSAESYDEYVSPICWYKCQEKLHSQLDRENG